MPITKVKYITTSIHHYNKANELPTVISNKSNITSLTSNIVSVLLIRIPAATATGIHLAINKNTLCLKFAIMFYFFLEPFLIFLTSPDLMPAVPAPRVTFAIT